MFLPNRHTSYVEPDGNHVKGQRLIPSLGLSPVVDILRAAMEHIERLQAIPNNKCCK